MALSAFQTYFRIEGKIEHLQVGQLPVHALQCDHISG